MTNINPLIANQQPIVMMLDVFDKSGTNQNIEHYISTRQRLSPEVKEYLADEMGFSEYDILMLEVDISSEIFHVLAVRAKELLSCTDDEADEFCEWITFETREDTYFINLVQECFLGAFTGNMKPIDEAITLYKTTIAA